MNLTFNWDGKDISIFIVKEMQQNTTDIPDLASITSATKFWAPTPLLTWNSFGIKIDFSLLAPSSWIPIVFMAKEGS